MHAPKGFAWYKTTLVQMNPESDQLWHLRASGLVYIEEQGSEDSGLCNSAGIKQSPLALPLFKGLQEQHNVLS